MASTSSISIASTSATTVQSLVFRAGNPDLFSSSAQVVLSPIGFTRTDVKVSSLTFFKAKAHYNLWGGVVVGYSDLVGRPLNVSLTVGNTKAETTSRRIDFAASDYLVGVDCRIGACIDDVRIYIQDADGNVKRFPEASWFIAFMSEKDSSGNPYSKMATPGTHLLPTRGMSHPYHDGIMIQFEAKEVLRQKVDLSPRALTIEERDDIIKESNGKLIKFIQEEVTCYKTFATLAMGNYVPGYVIDALNLSADAESILETSSKVDFENIPQNWEEVAKELKAKKLITSHVFPLAHVDLSYTVKGNVDIQREDLDVAGSLSIDYPTVSVDGAAKFIQNETEDRSRYVGAISFNSTTKAMHLSNTYTLRKYLEEEFKKEFLTEFGVERVGHRPILESEFDQYVSFIWNQVARFGTHFIQSVYGGYNFQLKYKIEVNKTSYGKEMGGELKLAIADIIKGKASGNYKELRENYDLSMVTELGGSMRNAQALLESMKEAFSQESATPKSLFSIMVEAMKGDEHKEILTKLKLSPIIPILFRAIGLSHTTSQLKLIEGFLKKKAQWGYTSEAQ